MQWEKNTVYWHLIKSLEKRLEQWNFYEKVLNNFVYFDKSAIVWHYLGKNDIFWDNNHVQKATMRLADNLESKVSKMPHTITRSQPDLTAEKVTERKDGSMSLQFYTFSYVNRSQRGNRRWHSKSRADGIELPLTRCVFSGSRIDFHGRAALWGP